MNIKNIIGNKIFLKVTKSASYLLGGEISAAVLNIFSLAIIARALGPEKLGVLTLFQSATLIISGALLPKPWISIVKYVVQFKEKREMHYIKALLKWSFKIEVIMAVIAVGLSFILSEIIIEFFKIESMYISYFRIYCLILVFQITGTSSGLLRAYNQFRILSISSILAAVIKLLFISIGGLLQKDFLFFLIAYMAMDITKQLFLMVVSLNLIIREGIHREKSVPLDNLKLKAQGALRFGIAMHFNDLLGTIRRNIDFVIVGVVLTTEMVGYYKVIKQFGKIFSMLGNPLKQSIYPETCSLKEQKKMRELYRLNFQITVILIVAFVFPIVFLFFLKERVIEIILGSEYIIILNPLVLYLIAHALFLSFQTLNILLLSFGKAKIVIMIELITNTVYLIGAYNLGQSFGLLGVVISFALSASVWIVISFFNVFHMYYYHMEVG